jgi:NAD(P)H-hydrate epimerase
MTIFLVKEMLKILNSSQVKQLDQFTINNAPISSIDLMERACKAFVDWFETHGSTEKKIGVICGTGNNGGDGLGISRMLVVKGYAVEVWIVRGSAPESADFKVNYQRICELVSPREICESLTSNPFTECDVLIDAIFGSGLSRPAEGIYAQVIQYINKTKAFRIAVDAPSGLLIDKPSSGEIIRATHTVTFQLPKLSFLMPQNADYVGQWHSVNIGLNREGMKEALTSHFLVERKDIKKIVRLMKRSTFSHKGNFGHVLLIAGSYGKMGAAVLSATAALRSGAGLVTVHTPGCGYQILQTTLPEAMVSIDPSAERFSAMPVMGGYTTVGIGPGIGTDVHTVKAFGELLQAVKNPMVIDADAINILSSNRVYSHLITGSLKD